MKLLRMLGLAAAAALLISACGGAGDVAGTTAAPGDDTATTSSDAEATTTLAAEEEDATTSTASSEDDSTATTAAEEMSGVHVADADLGEILVDPDGFTLYIFTNDTDGESVCYDGCADLWPPVPADTPISSDLDESMFGATTRDDGMDQLTVNDMPLYLYEPDTEPGDVNGQAFNGVWFVVDPDGSMVEAAAESTDDSVVDYGYP